MLLSTLQMVLMGWCQVDVKVDVLLLFDGAVRALVDVDVLLLVRTAIAC